MTKFHGPLNTSHNIFFEVMGPRDKETFRLAFSRGVPKKDREGKNVGEDFHKLAEARRWVNDVIRLWADKIDINHGLAFMVICSGGIDVVRRNFERRLTAHRTTLAKIHASKVSDVQRAHDLEVYHKLESAYAGWVDLDHANLAHALREPFVHCLSLRHPGTRIHDFTGAHTAKHGEQAKVGDGANPKPRRAPNKARKVIVEHRSIPSQDEFNKKTGNEILSEVAL